MKDAERRKLFIDWFNGPPLKGDREQLIQRSKLTKGRVSQLFDEDQQFGERAARSLAARLKLPPETFNTPRVSYPLSADIAPLVHAAEERPSSTPSLDEALPVVIEALSLLSPPRWAAIRMQLDMISGNPDLVDKAIAEIQHQLSNATAPSGKRRDAA